MLVITDSLDENLYLSSRNLPNVSFSKSNETDPVSLVRFPNVLVTRVRSPRWRRCGNERI